MGGGGVKFVSLCNAYSYFTAKCSDFLTLAAFSLA